MREHIDRIIELTKLDDKTLAERSLKGTEELGEFAQAVLSFMNVCGCGYKGKTVDDIIEEGIDLELVIRSVMVQAQGYEMDWEKYNAILNRKLDKWESKIKKPISNTK